MKNGEIDLPPELERKTEDLRRRAEKLLARRETETTARDLHDYRSLIHELEIHQVELELQNQELQQAHLEAEKARSKYFDLYDLAPVGNTTLTKNGEILEINLTGAKLLGQERSRLVHRRFQLFVEEKDVPTFNRFNQSVFLSGNRETCELTLFDGGPQLAEVRLEGIRTESHGERRCQTNIIDVTEQKKVERKYRESQERYRNLITASPDVIFEVDNKGAVTFVCERWTQWTGLKLEDSVGRGWLQAIPPEDLDAVEKLRAEILASGKFYESRHRIRNMDGSYRWIMVRTLPSWGSEGEIIHWVGTMTDVDDIVRAEEALQKARDELETRVRERTVDLSQALEKLRIENNQRQELEKTLRESENQVRFFASQCLTTQESERKRIAGELHDGIASSLIALKIRIERGAEKIDPGLNLELFHDLSSMVNEISGEIRRIMTDLRPAILDDLGIIPAMNWFLREYQKIYSRITVEAQVEVSEPEVPDSLKTPIFRITQEALNNIAKYSQASTVNLSFLKENNNIILAIQDNGRGFNLETVPKGLGLTTMRERAVLSGGTFAIEAAEGQGTTIRAIWNVDSI